MSNHSTTIAEQTSLSTSCPYLDTIQRSMLDFDFEKKCSVTLSPFNVYACLICGKYLQGRGKTSPAYYHSLHEDHHVFINLHTCQVYCLPDLYEVIDPSLHDIQYLLHPTFSVDQVAQLDRLAKASLDLNKRQYRAGFVGLNNIKANDYANVILQALTHVPPIRDYFLLFDHGPVDESSPFYLLHCFSELTRKIWNPKAYKGQVSPHALLQAIHTVSGKKYAVDRPADPSSLFTWLLNTLGAQLQALSLKKRKKSLSGNAILDTFQGKIQVTCYQPIDPKEQNKTDPPKVVTSSFLHLQLDLPPPPLYQDEQQRNLIPQVGIIEVLEKYNLSTPQDLLEIIKEYRIISLPRYLIFYIQRFNKNHWKNIEKNPTILCFPLKGLLLNSERDGTRKYDLIVNIATATEAQSSSGARSGSKKQRERDLELKGVHFKVHLQDKATTQWFEIQDLMVQQVMPQMIFMSESCIQIWERSDDVSS